MARDPPRHFVSATRGRRVRGTRWPQALCDSGAMPATALLVCVVIGIADGDTLTARCPAAAGPALRIVVRLADIDAPEKRQPFGTRSRQHLSALCFGKRAEIRPHAVDRYGRTVAHVVCEGSDAHAGQVGAGLAWAYTAYGRNAALAQLERQARVERRGLWSDPSPVAPWTWRRSRAEACDGPPPWHGRCLAGPRPSPGPSWAAGHCCSAAK